MKKQERFDAETLRSLLDYKSETGELVWKRRRGRGCRGDLVGKRAGSWHKDGYLHVSVLNSKYLAHRLVWLHVTGVWPSGEIDHINGIRSDNRIENIRDVSKGVNQQNQRSGKGAQKALGVDFYKAAGKFRARIKANGKTLSLGHFDTKDEAANAYIKAKRELHEGCTL